MLLGLGTDSRQLGLEHRGHLGFRSGARFGRRLLTLVLSLHMRRVELPREGIFRFLADATDL